MTTGPGKAPLFGAYRVDDEGVPAQRVSLVEHGVLEGLLMTRTPRKEIARSNGHARAPRFAGRSAHVGTLDRSRRRTGADAQGAARELARIAKGGGVTTYVVRLLDDGLASRGRRGRHALAVLVQRRRPRAAARAAARRLSRSTDGKETLVRGLTLERLEPRSLKDVTPSGRDPIVYNFIDEGGGFAGSRRRSSRRRCSSPTSTSAASRARTASRRSIRVPRPALALRRPVAPPEVRYRR